MELLAPLALLGQLPQHQVVLLPRLGEPLFKSTATSGRAAANWESKALCPPGNGPPGTRATNVWR